MTKKELNIYLVKDDLNVDVDFRSIEMASDKLFLLGAIYLYLRRGPDFDVAYGAIVGLLERFAAQPENAADGVVFSIGSGLNIRIGWPSYHIEGTVELLSYHDLDVMGVGRMARYIEMLCLLVCAGWRGPDNAAVGILGIYIVQNNLDVGKWLGETLYRHKRQWVLTSLLRAISSFPGNDLRNLGSLAVTMRTDVAEIHQEGSLLSIPCNKDRVFIVELARLPVEFVTTDPATLQWLIEERVALALLNKPLI